MAARDEACAQTDAARAALTSAGAMLLHGSQPVFRLVQLHELPPFAAASLETCSRALQAWIDFNTLKYRT